MKRKISCLCNSHFYVNHITSIYPHHECAKLHASHAFVPLLFTCLPFLTCLMYLHFFMCLHFYECLACPYFLRALSFFTCFTCLHFYTCFTYPNFSPALRAFIFYLPSVPFFRCLYFIYVLLRFLYTFIFLKCAYYLLCALSYSRTLLVFIFHNPNGGH